MNMSSLWRSSSVNLEVGLIDWHRTTMLEMDGLDKDCNHRRPSLFLIIEPPCIKCPYSFQVSLVSSVQCNCPSSLSKHITLFSVLVLPAGTQDMAWIVCDATYDFSVGDASCWIHQIHWHIRFEKESSLTVDRVGLRRGTRWRKDNAQQRSTQVMYVNTYWVCEIAKSLNHSPSRIGCGGKRERKSYPTYTTIHGRFIYYRYPNRSKQRSRAESGMRSPVIS